MREQDRPLEGDAVPPTNKGMLAAAGVLLVIPVIALMAVFTYARDTPELFGWPFFFWYQMLWIIITPVMTYGAYVLVLKARGQSPRDVQ